MRRISSVAVLFFTLLIACNTSSKEDKQGDLPQVHFEERNQGLIGDFVLSYVHSPVDSSTLLLKCFSRNYLSKNWGESWELVVSPVKMFPLYFNKKGQLITTDGKVVYHKELNAASWNSKSLPDGLKEAFFLNNDQGGLNLIARDQNDEIIVSSPEYFFNKSKKIDEGRLDSLYDLQTKYLINQFFDSSQVSLGFGHLLVKNESNIWEKRMEGISKPEVKLLLQPSPQANKVYLIQRGLSTSFAPGGYYLYTTEDFGENWLLEDSAKSMSQLLEKESVTMALEEAQARILNPGKEYSSLLVNDSLQLTKNENLSSLLLFNKNEKYAILEEGEQGFELLPSFKLEPGLEGLPLLPMYATKINENGELEVLFASDDGGVGYLKVSLKN